jgi:hypothetical protein
MHASSTLRFVVPNETQAYQGSSLKRARMKLYSFIPQLLVVVT